MGEGLDRIARCGVRPIHCPHFVKSVGSVLLGGRMAASFLEPVQSPNGTGVAKAEHLEKKHG